MRGVLLTVALMVAITGGAVALIVGSVGGGPALSVPTFPSFAAPSGDAATFLIDGQSIAVRQSGTVSVSGYDHLDYTGPLGCRGRYFTADLTPHIRVLFRYDARQAWIHIGVPEEYHLVGPPRRRKGTLVWHTRQGGRTITVIASCPTPPRAAAARS